MHRKKPVNFEELAKHILTIVDDGKHPLTGKVSPEGSLPALTALLTLCFGAEGAEAIAREVILELELYEVEGDGIEVDPLPHSRNAFLADLLRKEFSE